jgi:hypothetical protein
LKESELQRFLSFAPKISRGNMPPEVVDQTLPSPLGATVNYPSDRNFK